MFFKDYKFEIIIGSGLALMSVYLFYQLLTIKPKQVNPLDKMSFEMIRPQNDAVNEFTLDGREIDSRFENPFVKKNSGHKDQKDGKPKLVPITQKNTAKKEDKAKKQEPAKKKGMQVRVVPRDSMRPLSPDENSEFTPYANNKDAGNGQNKNNLPKNEDTKNEEKKRSLSEFADLLTDPKSERVKELIAALSSGEINTAELYPFIERMLQTTDKPAVQSVGIYLAYYSPTYESFRVVTTHQDKLSPEVKAYSEQFLTSFSQASKLPILAQALQSSDIKVVVKAGEVIIMGLQKIKNGQSIDYGARNNRGNNEAKSSSFLGYFLPIAENLKSSQNQTIASIGSALSQQLSQLGTTP